MSLNHPANIMEKDSVASFLDEFSNKSENPFDVQPKDPFNQEIIPEEKAEEPEKEDKPVPFHKDPKVQRFIEKEINKRMADIKPAEPTKEKVSQDDEDDYYARLIGNDTPEKVAMIREAKLRDQKLLEQAEERAFNRLSRTEQEKMRAEQEAEQELTSAFENIEETFDVDISSNNPIAKKTRQEFVAFVEKIAPKDRNGTIVDYPDMNSAWETFQTIQKSTAQPNRAKELAARSMARSAETKVDLNQKRTTWDDAERFIETLK
jgi:hypothetical protein